MSKNPIGVFDSGYGGLTILKELVAALPEFDYLYLGDNARAPYGDKTFKEVYAYTLQSVEWFFKQGCSLVILACNTASAKALRTIQQNDLPLIDPNKRVLGVIRPTSEVIGQLTHSNHIGILGTQGTIKSESYVIEIAKFFPEIKVTQEACPEWVSLVEKNLYETTEADYFVKCHIDSILSKDSNSCLRNSTDARLGMLVTFFDARENCCRIWCIAESRFLLSSGKKLSKICSSLAALVSFLSSS
jgi:glutamate racemase